VRKPVATGKPLRSAKACRSARAAADDHKRPLRAGEDRAQTNDIVRRRKRTRALGRRQIRNAREFIEHVFGNRQHDGPRPARHRDRIGVPHHFRNPRRRLDLHAEFRDAGEHLHDVDFLPTFAALICAHDAADEHDHRR
jgi:hypothetical protein